MNSMKDVNLRKESMAKETNMMKEGRVDDRL